MEIHSRSNNFTDYRFGFNGKEADTKKEWGELTHYDYGFRIYNPSIAKFLSVDPLSPDYPWYTPYQFAGNMPIQAIDLDGLEPRSMIRGNGKLTEPVIALLSAAFNYDKASLRASTWSDYMDSGKGLFWFWMTDYPTASVSGEDVFYHGTNTENDTPAEWLGLIAHEEFHRQQVDLLGAVLFYAGYGAEGLVKRYREISTEKGAYFYGSNDYSFDRVDELIGMRVLDILERPLAFDSEKIADLETLGKSFRALVVLPEMLKYNNGIINDLRNKIKSGDGDPELIEKYIEGIEKINEDVKSEINKINFELGVSEENKG